MMESTTDAGHTVRLERRFEAPRERVFRAFTEAEELRRWYAPGDAVVAFADADVRVGGELRLHMRGPDGTVYRLRCEYRLVEPPSRLTFTWKWEHEGAGETLVALEFEEDGAGTLVRLVHTGFGTEQDRAGHGEGWRSLFEKLSALL